MFLQSDIAVTEQQSWIPKLSLPIIFRTIDPVIHTLRFETHTLDEADRKTVQEHR